MKLKILIVALGMLFFLPFCGQKDDTGGARLDITIQPETVTDELYVKMNYNFTLPDTFPGFEDDHVVFVHFWRTKNKEMLMGDDHQPEKKFSTWKAGENVQYSRVVFIPKFLDEFDLDFEGYEELQLTVGLYRPKVKNSNIVLFKKTINVKAASLSAPEVVYDEGWWQVESDPKAEDVNEKSWRWTSKKATCIIENPGKESLLILTGRVDKQNNKDQKVIFRINGKTLDEFVPETDSFSKEYIVTPDTMGKNDEFTLTLETNKTFIPSEVIPNSKDTRELGFRIFRLYFREHVR